MLMPPVVLMGGGGGGSGSSAPAAHSVPASPIVEMPPSPAPGHDMMFVEFPEDDDDHDGDDYDGNSDEVDERRGRMYTTEDVANANIVNEVRISNRTFILLHYYYSYYASMRINKIKNQQPCTLCLACSHSVSLSLSHSLCVRVCASTGTADNCHCHSNAFVTRLGWRKLC